MSHHSKDHKLLAEAYEAVTSKPVMEAPKVNPVTKFAQNFVKEYPKNASKLLVAKTWENVLDILKAAKPNYWLNHTQSDIRSLVTAAGASADDINYVMDLPQIHELELGEVNDDAEDDTTLYTTTDPNTPVIVRIYDNAIEQSKASAGASPDAWFKAAVKLVKAELAKHPEEGPFDLEDFKGWFKDTAQ